MSSGPCSVRPLTRVEHVDDPLAAELDLDVSGEISAELHDLAVGAVLADERLAVDVEVHHDLRDQVDARRPGRRALEELHDAGVVAGRHAARSVRRYACSGSVEIPSASTRTHA